MLLLSKEFLHFVLDFSDEIFIDCKLRFIEQFFLKDTVVHFSTVLGSGVEEQFTKLLYVVGVVLQLHYLYPPKTQFPYFFVFAHPEQEVAVVSEVGFLLGPVLEEGVFEDLGVELHALFVDLLYFAVGLVFGHDGVYEQGQFELVFEGELVGDVV